MIFSPVFPNAYDFLSSVDTLMVKFWIENPDCSFLCNAVVLNHFDYEASIVHNNNQSPHDFRIFKNILYSKFRPHKMFYILS